jgi:hypothetical protein
MFHSASGDKKFIYLYWSFRCLLDENSGCFLSPCEKLSLSHQIFSKQLSIFFKKCSEFLQFFGTVTDAITFCVHNFENIWISVVPLKYFKIKFEVNVLKNTMLSSSRNRRFKVTLLFVIHCLFEWTEILFSVVGLQPIFLLMSIRV